MRTLFQRDGKFSREFVKMVLDKALRLLYNKFVECK